MQKLSKKQREWLIKKSQRAMRKLTKEKKMRHRPYDAIPTAPQRPQNSTSHGAYRRTQTVVAPLVLSLIDNVDETLQFFNSVFEAANRCKMNDRIYFDLSKIKSITTEAIMYIIALIRNLKRTKTLRVMCEGNLPEDSSARKVIEKSGFYRFVKTEAQRLYTPDTSQIQVSSGLQADCVLAARICDFVQREAQTNRRGTKILYRMIMELMTNTQQHAYQEASNAMFGNWYIYAEDMPSCIHFVFLDTGAGIPATIRKGFGEKVQDLLRNDDAAYIASAFNKEAFRTATKQEYRGKGLPEIYAHVVEGIAADFRIISGQGMCHIQSDGQIVAVENSIDFRGTLFIWNCPKEAMKEVA